MSTTNLRPQRKEGVVGTSLRREIKSSSLISIINLKYILDIPLESKWRDGEGKSGAQR